ncbi:hypothetical protein EDD29_2313 [Actinocorallia herbida]|uniref:Secreted protein n=1 Tax=Actinocorallia herbida TaxID=58109 RepID=A0A3N1CUB3_9ACTN|nr:hypothetical protein [Actinocorallia herbida]ROO84784.1 hypothetical protein EDD29_2313 [Actinocorallia herbida]
MRIRPVLTTAAALAALTTAPASATPQPPAPSVVVAITFCQEPDYKTCDRYGVDTGTAYQVPAPYTSKLASARTEPAGTTCTLYKYENAMGRLAEITPSGTSTLEVKPTSFRCTAP